MATVLELERQSDTPSPYKIDKAIPLPERRRGKATLYPLRTMEVGDSFLIPCGDSERDREITHRRVTAAWHHVKGRKFTARRIVGEGVRVWRLA